MMTSRRPIFLVLLPALALAGTSAQGQTGNPVAPPPSAPTVSQNANPPKPDAAATNATGEDGQGQAHPTHIEPGGDDQHWTPPHVEDHVGNGSDDPGWSPPGDSQSNGVDRRPRMMT